MLVLVHDAEYGIVAADGWAVLHVVCLAVADLVELRLCSVSTLSSTHYQSYRRGDQ